MKEWQEAALKYHQQGLGLKEITAKIELEFDMYDAYDTVRCYIYRQKQKTAFQQAKPYLCRREFLT